MGFYINPGNGNFREIWNDDYIDKSGLISVINRSIDKKNRLSCVSRASGLYQQGDHRGYRTHKTKPHHCLIDFSMLPDPV